MVAQDGSSKYTTISAAIRDARQGDRILVQPGNYFESIVIDKNVDILGEGTGEDVTLCFSGDHVVTGMCEKGSLKYVSNCKLFFFGVRRSLHHGDSDRCVLEC